MSGQYLLAAGVRSDFGIVLLKLNETGSVRFSDFSTIWKELGMSMIFAGHQSDKELRQFTEECLSLACRMWIDSEGFQEQVCGLYLLYSLYMTQLDEPKSKIRLTRADWLAAMKFLAEVHEQQHLDVEYVFISLRFHKAFHFVASAVPVTVQMFVYGGRTSEADQESRDTLQQTKEQPSMVSQILQLNSIEQLSAIHEKYHELKCAMAGQDSSEPSPSLNFIHTNLVQSITKAATAHEEWKKRKYGKKGDRKRRESGATTSESEIESDVEMWMPPKQKKKKKSSIGQQRRMLKDRAFQEVTSPTGSRRHRQVKSSDTDSSLSSPSKARKVKQPRLDSTIEEEPQEDPSSSKSPTEEKEYLDMPLFIVEEPLQIKGRGRGRGSPRGKGRTPKSSRKQVSNEGKDSPADTSSSGNIGSPMSPRGRGKQKKEFKSPKKEMT